MKILILSDPNSSHTIKWFEGLAKKGLDVKVWGFNYNRPKLLQLNEIKRVLKEFNPDILHAHYASSYGLLGALCNFNPFILSVWGSDVFEFPKLSYINKYILKYNFYKADKILSTSQVMAKEVRMYTNKNVIVTPFGVDINIFKPSEVDNKKDIITIGLIKSLKEIYGIEYAIKAFAIVLSKLTKKNIKFLIVGDGSLEPKLKNLVAELKISDFVEFVGKIPYDKIVNYHNKIDIFINASLQESFGVSVLEASACEKPVIVSNVGGLPEVVEDNVSGIIVEVKNIQAIAKAIENLLIDENLRISMGKAGRKFVKKKYNWSDNINQMVNIYEELLK